MTCRLKHFFYWLWIEITEIFFGNFYILLTLSFQRFFTEIVIIRHIFQKYLPWIAPMFWYVYWYPIPAGSAKLFNIYVLLFYYFIYFHAFLLGLTLFNLTEKLLSTVYHFFFSLLFKLCLQHILRINHLIFIKSNRPRCFTMNFDTCWFHFSRILSCYLIIDAISVWYKWAYSSSILLWLRHYFSTFFKRRIHISIFIGKNAIWINWHSLLYFLNFALFVISSTSIWVLGV